MRQEIQSAVKSAYLQYGLKPENIEKIVTALETRLTAAGTTTENLQTSINEAVEFYRPALALIQSEVDLRAKKPTSEAPTPASADEPEWAKASRLQMESLRQEVELLRKDKENHQKNLTQQEVLQRASDLSKSKGAENPVLRDAALKLVGFQEGMTAEQLVEKGLVEYNKLQSSLAKDSVVPLIPSLGDKAAVEAARAKGKEVANQILGSK